MLFSFAKKHPSKRRISFFMNFIHSFGKSVSDVMKDCKMAGTYLSNVIFKDNLKVSAILKICRALGYSCQFYLEPPNPAEAQLYRERAYRTNITGSHWKNMGFLRDFCEIEGIRPSDISKKLGYARGRVSVWLKVDDLDLRRIYAICKAYNRNLHVVIKPLSPSPFKESQQGNDDSMVIFDLSHHHCYPFGENFSSREEEVEE